MNHYFARDFYNARTQLVAVTNAERVRNHR
jgi:hypothetical protein